MASLVLLAREDEAFWDFGSNVIDSIQTYLMVIRTTWTGRRLIWAGVWVRTSAVRREI